MGLAIAAAAVEVASMLRYLVGIGLLSTGECDAGTRLLVLAGYCLDVDGRFGHAEVFKYSPRAVATKHRAHPRLL